MIYLDHNATAPMLPAVIDAMTAAFQDCGNPSSIHASGRNARRKVENARDGVAGAINLPPGGSIVFTSGGTEANQLALRGAGRPHVLASAIEHDSVRSALPAMISIPVTSMGIVDLTALHALLAAQQRPAIVSVMAANNETGIVQPIEQIAKIAHGFGALFHCDAVQAIGRLHFDMAALGIDLVTLSAHKIGGPQGVGALAIAPGLDLTAMQTGGGQERGLRAGTENVAGIVGFGTAITEIPTGHSAWLEIADLRDRLEASLVAACPAAAIFGKDVDRLANTSCIAMPGVSAETQIIAFDLAGIAVSAGAACTSGKLGTSHVLGAMEVEPSVARTAIRVSLCRDTTHADINALLAAWSALYARHSARHAA